MKLINRSNFISVLCITYTIISLFICIFESIIYKEVSHDHFNLLLCFLLSFISILILSQHYRLDRFPTLVVIVFQYIIALFCLFSIMIILSAFVEVSPGGYKDMFISFTIPYIIGTIVYYVSLRAEVKKQNRILNEIKERKSINNNSK